MHSVPALLRLALALGLGVLVAVVVAAPIGLMWGWVTAASTYCVLTWLAVLPMDAAQTKAHASDEDAGRAVVDVVLLLASVASVGGVAALLASTHSLVHPWQEELAGVAGVVASWLLVHTLFGLRYARLYMAASPSPVDFGDEEPDYHDFFYLAFTLGMTYQVSDTALRSRALRREALRHALLSYLLGAVVVASAVNLLVQLAN